MHKLMRHFVPSLLFFVALGACTGAPLATGSETPAAGAAFPEAWIGSWQGEVTAFGPGGERMRFEMLRDRATGAYAIDEHNGIVLDARLLDDTLFSCFEVQGTRLFVRERLVQHEGAPALSFEIATGSHEGNTTGEAIPVINYPTTGLQRAVLRLVSLSGIQ